MRIRTRDQINDDYLAKLIERIDNIYTEYEKNHRWLFGLIAGNNSSVFKQLSDELHQTAIKTTDTPFEKYSQMLKVIFNTAFIPEQNDPRKIIKNFLINELSLQEEAEWSVPTAVHVIDDDINTAILQIDDKSFYPTNNDYQFCKKWHVITDLPAREVFPFWTRIQSDITTAFENENYMLIPAIIDQSLNVEKKSLIRLHDDDELYSQPGMTNINSTALSATIITPLSKEEIKRELPIWNPENIVLLMMDYIIHSERKTPGTLENDLLIAKIRSTLGTILSTLVKAKLVNKLMFEDEKYAAIRMDSIRNNSVSNDHDVSMGLELFDNNFRKLKLYHSQHQSYFTNPHAIISMDRNGTIKTIMDDKLRTMRKPTPVQSQKHTSTKIRENSSRIITNTLIGGVAGVVVGALVCVTLFFTLGLTTLPLIGIGAGITFLFAGATAGINVIHILNKPEVMEPGTENTLKKSISDTRKINAALMQINPETPANIVNSSEPQHTLITKTDLSPNATIPTVTARPTL